MGIDAHPKEPGELSLASVVAIIRKYRSLIVGLPATLFGITVLFTFLQRRPYESTAAFMPQAGDASQSRLAGLAAQFGINVPLGGSGQSLGFYAELVKSREIMGEIVRTKFTVLKGSDSVTADLMDLYEVAGKNDGERFEAGLKRLKESFGVSWDPVAGVVKMSFRSRWPTLSHDVLERALALVNDFNLRRRQTQAGAERAFVSNRMEAAKAELREAENELQGFLQGNREYNNSATLRFQYDRLSRAVSLRQQVYTGLAQSFEQARIEEIRNTPLITTVEQPNVPANPVSRRLIMKAFAAILVGGMLAVAIAFGLEIYRRELRAA